MHRAWPNLPRDYMTFVVAKEQTQGRGRFKDRSWSSPRGNLYLTCALFLDSNRQDVAHLGQIAALGALSAIYLHGIGPGCLGLKWPNDIMMKSVDGVKKVGGVLVEVLDDPLCLHHVCLIGMGLNIETVPVLQERFQPTAALFQKSEIDVEAMTESVMNQLNILFNLFIQKGFTPFLEAYAAMLVHHVGDLLVSVQGDKKIEGQFVGVDSSGALILDVEGQRRLFMTGEWSC